EGPERWTLSVRVGLGQDPDALLQESFSRHVETSRLLATGTARQGAAVELTWTVGLRAGSTPTPSLPEPNPPQARPNLDPPLLRAGAPPQQPLPGFPVPAARGD